MNWNRSKCDERLAELKFPSAAEEMGFYKSPCYLCGSPLGGDRHRIDHADDDTKKYPPGGVLIPSCRILACTDCVIYLECGIIPERRTKKEYRQ